ncbi:MAG: putative prolin-rich transrane protein [Labilithrix sp.]|nr:putative prolin-rich transrane protein [Labilithrix sp.]
MNHQDMVERITESPGDGGRRLGGLFRLKRLLGASALAIGGLLAMGCGRYEPEPEYPQQQYAYVAPTPPTAAELAAQQQAREQAAAESREVLIGADEDEYSDTDPSALTEFKPALDGHGAWVEDASYGTVWVPSKEEVGADFQPYVSAGHWTYSDTSDYVWVSDYSWGWAPFHYGRWVLLPGHGWSWIPGRRYAGAWVTWRVGPAGYGYVGWAPAAPAWYWSGGVAYGWSFGWYNHHDHYVYCSHNHFYQPVVSTHVVRGAAAREYDGRTHDYVPARPGVGGGSGDRVVANPSVGGSGSDRVLANPSVGGNRVVANPGVRGPKPDEFGVKPDAIVAPPAANPGLGRAQALAVPSTAVAAGAAAPAHLRTAPAFNRDGVGNPRAFDSNARMPASNGFVPSNTSRSNILANQQPRVPPSGSTMTPPPVYRTTPSFTPSPTPPPAYRATPSFGSSPPPSSQAVRPSFGATSPSPSFRSSAPVQPSFRSSPPSPSFRSSAPVQPSFRSSAPSPSFRSSAPAVRSTPSFRPSSPSPSFRSSAPAVRSSPSFSSPSRSSAPAVRSGGSIRRR